MKFWKMSAALGLLSSLTACSLLDVQHSSQSSGSYSSYGVYDIYAGQVTGRSDAPAKCGIIVNRLKREYPDEYFRWTGDWREVGRGKRSVCAIESSVDLSYYR